MLVLPADAKEQIDELGALDAPIEYNSVNEQSQLTYLRLREVLRRWNDLIVAGRLEREHKPKSYTSPVKAKGVDVALLRQAGRGVWARLFPFLLVIMSLTGAFYPAIDLCAGEKERGTMETLLISPASRSEIVLGKFFTVLVASVVTAFLNLASMALTGAQLARQAGAFAQSADRAAAASVISAPSLGSMFWMILLLIPLAGFFSAVCLALAVMAKSMKEGQYYMTPLYLVSLPLIFLTLAPGVNLDAFYSLVPITGVSLLLRSLLQGDFVVARKYFLPVLIPTCIYGVLALRWAVDQFLREDVLFREAERFDLKGWLGHLMKSKRETPNGAEAFLCFILMLSSAWFLLQLMADQSPTAMVVGQVAFVLTPPLAMAFLLTSSPRRTLRLYWPRAEYVFLALGLAISLHPLVKELGWWVQWFFPIDEVIQERLAAFLKQIPNTLTLFVLFAFVPAVCEEFAFRGFILSGLQRSYRQATAVVLSALLFGYMHVLFSLNQQVFNSIILGLLLGLLAVRSGSILPGILFHLGNNGLAVLVEKFTESAGDSKLVAWLYRNPAEGLYHWYWLLFGAIVSIVLTFRLARGVPAVRPRVEPAEIGAEV